MDYYTTLGVTRSSSFEEINRAFRDLAKRYHPDRNPDNPEAEKKFKEITNAYATLIDPERRREYDLRCRYKECSPVVKEYREQPEHYADFVDVINAIVDLVGCFFGVANLSSIDVYASSKRSRRRKRRRLVGDEKD
jgi:DnaJ-class molecular chaperone